jgi:hypothetical protein
MSFITGPRDKRKLHNEGLSLGTWNRLADAKGKGFITKSGNDYRLNREAIQYAEDDGFFMRNANFTLDMYFEITAWLRKERA